MRKPEEENRKPKQLVAAQALDIAGFKAVRAEKSQVHRRGAKLCRCSAPDNEPLRTRLRELAEQWRLGDIGGSTRFFAVRVGL